MESHYKYLMAENMKLWKKQLPCLFGGQVKSDQTFPGLSHRSLYEFAFELFTYSRQQQELEGWPSRLKTLLSLMIKPGGPFTRWSWSLLVNRYPTRSAWTKTEGRRLPLFRTCCCWSSPEARVWPKASAIKKPRGASVHSGHDPTINEKPSYFRVWHFVTCGLNLHLMSQMKKSAGIC